MTTTRDPVFQAILAMCSHPARVFLCRPCDIRTEELRRHLLDMLDPLIASVETEQERREQ